MRRLWLALASAGMLAIPPALQPGMSVAVGARSLEAEDGIVVAVEGSDRLVVVGDDGQQVRVHYIGLVGPLQSSHFAAEAAGAHAGLVVGRRVRLETEGPTEHGGFQLRHVFVEDGGRPVGAEMVEAGWARAAPYPRQHAFRALYLELQEQALADQRNLWQPGVLGPALVWRPRQAADGYILTDPALIPALEALESAPTGSRLLAEVTALGPLYRVRTLDEHLYGSANSFGFLVDINSTLLASDQRSPAAALAHESIHLIDFTLLGSSQPEVSCFETEIRAHTVLAEVWREFFGPSGKPDPHDTFEGNANMLLRYVERGDLESYVRLSTSYQRQCAGER